MASLEEIARDLGTADLPRVTLVVGGDPARARAAAEDAVRQHGALASDVLFVRKLTSPSAHDAARYAWTAPYGPFKAIIISLDGATGQAQNRLLKALEEAPETTRFILLSPGGLPLPAIVSRAVVHHAADSREDRPVPEAAAGKAAAAVTAARTGDPALLCGVVASGWDEDCVRALQRWAAGQAAAYRPELHGAPRLGPEVTARQARIVLRVLSDHPRARPVNVAVAALSAAFLEE